MPNIPYVSLQKSLRERASMPTIPPRLHHLPESSKFSKMICIMICHKEHLAQNSLAAPMRNGSVQIHGGISNYLTQHLKICANGGKCLFPGIFIGLCVLGRPIAFRP